jgi:hypothetical protein
LQHLVEEGVDSLAYSRAKSAQLGPQEVDVKLKLLQPGAREGLKSDALDPALEAHAEDRHKHARLHHHASGR